jgi:hypothetical protein
MASEQSFNVTIKINHLDGSIASARLLKARSKLPDDILDKLNEILATAFDQPIEQPSLSAPPIAVTQTSVALGNIAEQVVLSHLRTIERVNQDFSVDDTSSLTKHGDIAVTTQEKRICIEVKNYSKPCPAKELDKFHQSVALPDYNAGIIIQMNECGYARERSIKSPIDVRVINGKPVAYLTATDNDLLYPIITMLLALIKEPTHGDLQATIEKKTRQLMDVHERSREMKVCIESQKKSVARMEALLNDVLAITID